MEGYFIGFGILMFILIILAALFKINRRLTPVSQWTKNGSFVGNYQSITETSRMTGISYSGISNCCRGVQKTSGGHVWKPGNFKIQK